MNHYMSSQDLRDQAKEKLSGAYGASIFIFLLYVILNSCIKNMLHNLFVLLGANLENPYTIVSMGLTWLSSLLCNVLDIGLVFYFINLYCGNTSGGMDLLYGFRNHFSKSLGLAAILGTLSFVCFTPIDFFLSKATTTTLTRSLTYAMFATAIGIVVYYVSWLYLHLSVYILLDFPDKSLGEIVHLSFTLMKGNLLRLLYLKVSFLPLYLLGFLSFGLGLLWVIPYDSMAEVSFYMNLMDGRGTPQDTVIENLAE